MGVCNLCREIKLMRQIEMCLQDGGYFCDRYTVILIFYAHKYNIYEWNARKWNPSLVYNLEFSARFLLSDRRFGWLVLDRTRLLLLVDFYGSFAEVTLSKRTFRIRNVTLLICMHCNNEFMPIVALITS